MIFLGALALTAFTTTRQSVAFDRQGMRMTVALVTALLVLPIAFVTAGFVASSTMLFAIASTTLRAQSLSVRAIAIDLSVGAAFSIALFLLFTRGLGVMLPGFF
jgi:hypothetical protein